MPATRVPSGAPDRRAVLSVPDADQLLRDHTRRLPTETVGLDDAAGRVLAADVCAERDLPPFDRVTMDGVALQSAAVQGGIRRFRVASQQRAGEPPHTLPGRDACIDVATGAVLPVGCDAVVAAEHVRLEDGVAELVGVADVRSGAAVHRRGTDRVGGALVVRGGTRVGPAHVAALASVGAPRVPVSARARIAVVTTGDELVAVDGPVLAHQVRRSNGHALRAALGLHGFAHVTLAHAPDDREALAGALARALASADVVVTTGGVSVGRLDLVPDVLVRLGVRCVFHRVAQRPGKPLWFGVDGTGTAVFGLPGNPVSALVGLVRYVVPLLRRMEGDDGPPDSVVLESLPARPPGLTVFVPVSVEAGVGRAVSGGGSGDLVSLLPTDGVAEVALGAVAPAAFPFFPWRPR